jgi:hypothetical protein
MKNITVSVKDSIYHRARIRAAELRTSVSAMVGRFLEETAAKETPSERLMRLERETVEGIEKRLGGFSGASRLSRDELHDRYALR